MSLAVNEISMEEIHEGAVFSHRYEISRQVYDGFLAAFGDVSPIHVNEEYARSCGFDGVVMHGAILNGFVSHFVGVRFPGRRAMLLSVDLRYKQPCFLGERIELAATVLQKVESVGALKLKVSLTSLGRGVTVAEGVVQVKVREA